jgi:hypothetical protein
LQGYKKVVDLRGPLRPKAYLGHLSRELLPLEWVTADATSSRRFVILVREMDLSVFYNENEEAAIAALDICHSN